MHYLLLVAHILFGSVALVAACLQIWPWLRRTRPAVHRWSGRAYLFGGVFPGGLAVAALTFSIVTNRIWLVAYFLLFSPLLGDDPTALAVAAAGASVWSSWVVNLLVVEWWVLRPAGRRRHRAV